MRFGLVTVILVLTIQAAVGLSDEAQTGGCSETLIRSTYQGQLDQVNATIQANPNNSTAWRQKSDILHELGYQFRVCDGYVKGSENYAKWDDEYENLSAECLSKAWKLEHPIIDVHTENVQAIQNHTDELLNEIKDNENLTTVNSSDHNAWFKIGRAYMGLSYQAGVCEFDGSANLTTQNNQKEACNRSHNESQEYANAALTNYQSAIKAAGNRVPLDYWFYKGNAHRVLGEYSEALACYSKFVDLSSKSSDYHANTYYLWGLYAEADVCSLEGKYDLTANYLETYLSKDLYDYRVWKKLSTAYKRLGRYEDATNAANQATLSKELTSGTGTLPTIPNLYA